MSPNTYCAIIFASNVCLTALCYVEQRKEEEKKDIFPCRFTIISVGSSSAALTNSPPTKKKKVK